jgi:hypothetical protein
MTLPKATWPDGGGGLTHDFCFTAFLPSFKWFILLTMEQLAFYVESLKRTLLF